MAHIQKQRQNRHTFVVHYISIFLFLLAGCAGSPTPNKEQEEVLETPTPAPIEVDILGKGGPTPQNSVTPTATATKTPTPKPPANPNQPYPCPNCWRPPLQTSWQWQLTGKLDTSHKVMMYDIDLYSYSAEVVAQLHRAGHRVTCYINAGSWEPYRPDAAAYPASIKGKPVQNWEDERWFDIRQSHILRPLMLARIDLCKAKGFDSVEFDLVHAYTYDTGFPITYQDQLNYNKFLANAAHERGLSVALKENPGQVKDLVAYFDWGLTEGCYQHEECDKWLPFIQAGKPVMHVEYELDPADFCPHMNKMNFNSLKLPLSLDGEFRTACR